MPSWILFLKWLGQNMKPHKIILIRHGESEGNADRSNYETIPDFALTLTTHGKTQAVLAGEEIKSIIGTESVYAYISPYIRTKQTFDAIQSVISRNIHKSIEDPRLRELDWGHLRHPDDNEEIIHERNEFSTFYYRIKDGESGADVYDRISGFLETLYRDFNKPGYPENALIVTHGMTLRIFLMRWFHWSIEKFENLRNPENGQIVVMEKDTDDNYKIITQLERRK